MTRRYRDIRTTTDVLDIAQDFRIPLDDALSKSASFTSDLDLEIRECRLILSQKLIDEVMIAAEDLSTHQLQILLLSTTHMYKEIAEQMNICYTGIPHSLNGIYSKKHNVYHGGSIPKLRKILMNKPEVVELLRQIKVIGDDDQEELRRKILLMEDGIDRS